MKKVVSVGTVRQQVDDPDFVGWQVILTGSTYARRGNDIVEVEVTYFFIYKMKKSRQSQVAAMRAQAPSHLKFTNAIVTKGGQYDKGCDYLVRAMYPSSEVEEIRA